MSGHDVIRPAGWPRPKGYAHGVLAQPGRVLAIAGQIGWDVECRIVGERFVDQLEQALRNVRSVLEEAGGAPEHLVSLTIYVADRHEYLASLREVGERYRAVIGAHYPAMALVEVSALLEAGAKVEVQALAVIPPGAGA
ncbi:MAG: RidA family protein [Acidobacteriota bacterium]